MDGHIFNPNRDGISNLQGARSKSRIPHFQDNHQTTITTVDNPSRGLFVIDTRKPINMATPRSILKTSRDDDEASSVASADSAGSDASGGGRYLNRLFGGPQPPTQQPPSSPSWGQKTIIPQYSAENRMLMRSPLPSPTPVVRKQIVKPHVGGSPDGDSDSEAGSEDRRKREQAHVSRLVHMAKAQQHLMTAWFAASAGAESVSLPVRKPRRRKPPPRRQSSNASAASSGSSGSSRSGRSKSGPVDLDELTDDGEVDDEESVVSHRSSGSQQSSGSSKMRMFLNGILGSTISVANADQPSVATGATPRINNVTKPQKKYQHHEADIEEQSEPTYASTAEASVPVLVVGKCKFSRNQLILVILGLIFAIALITVVASTLTGNNDSTNESAIGRPVVDENERPPFVQLRLPTLAPSAAPSLMMSAAPSVTPPSQSPSRSAVPSTPSPTFNPSAFPSKTPSTMPSLYPSGVPSSQPSALPSLSPTTTPSLAPSGLPSLAPSLSPTSTPSTSPSLSQTPSATPSSSPTTSFSTTTFTSVGDAILGEQAGEQFGHASALNADGSILAVGARYFANNGQERAGRVEVYQRLDNNEWINMGQALYGRNEQDQFGFSVALSDSGNILAVAEPGFDGPVGGRSGNVRVFEWNGQAWVPLGGEIVGEQVASLFGVSISLSANGSRLAVGSPYNSGESNLSLSGRVRVFELVDFQWQPLGQPLDGSYRLDWFGWSVDLSSDGNRLAVGAPRNRIHGGYARVYNFNSENWTQIGGDIVNDLLNVHPEDRFGLAVSLDGDRVAIGSPWKDSSALFNSGMVAVYQFGVDGWAAVGAPVTGDEINGQMGTSVKLRGLYLTVGSPEANNGSGMVTFHMFDGYFWDTASDPLLGSLPAEDFGRNVDTDVDSRTIAVGAPATTSNDPLTGLLRVFTR